MKDQIQMEKTRPQNAVNLGAESSLGQWASQQPASMVIFHRLELDYCCGGKRSLAAACQSAGLSVEEVLKELRAPVENQEAKKEPRYDQMGMFPLIEHITEHHHAYLRKHLPEIVRLSSKIASVHGGGHPFLHELEASTRSLSDELMNHMHKEEAILFPYIQELALYKENPEQEGRQLRPGFGTVRNPVRMMMEEHDQAGDFLKQMRALTNDYQLPEGACMTWWQTYNMMQEMEADLMQHIHLENNILFPAAIAAEMPQ